MPKKNRKRTGAANRHDPLAATIDADGKRHLVQQKVKTKQNRKNQRNEEEGEGAVPAKLSRKIMRMAQQQQEDLGEGIMLRGPGPAKDDEYDEDDSDDDDDFGGGVRREGDYIGAGEMNEEEEAALSQFMPKQNQMNTQTLGDIIAEKIREKEQAERDADFEMGGDGKSSNNNNNNNNNNTNGAGIQYSRRTSDKVIEVYTRVGNLLTRYRAGKVPKAFKIIPALRNWEEVLMITNPEKWSPHAMYVATKIFASNLNPKNAQRFYNLILLPAVRDDIRKEKKLNYHLYRSLKKAIYKPAAFFKGVLLPLCEKREGCTLREGEYFVLLLLFLFIVFTDVF